jgi:DnaJ-class molecular chaperone
MEWNTVDFKGSGIRLGRKAGQVLEGDDFTCSLCSGKGTLPRSEGTKSSVCRGEGAISLSGPVVVCAYCKGRGDFPARTNITCTVCKGKGLVSITKPIKVCANCRGTGAEPSNKLPCLECRGKGVVAKKETKTGSVKNG